MDPDEQPQIPADDLTDEQKELLAGVERQRRAAVLMDRMSEQIQREAQRQNRWIERQIWETDWTEVEVLDIVTLDGPEDSLAREPMEATLVPDIKAYRYANAADAPGGEKHPGDDVGFYSNRANRSGNVQRVTRDMFRDLVEEEGVEPPEWLDVTPDTGGDRGPDDGANPDEFDREEALKDLREERLDDLDGGA